MPRLEGLPDRIVPSTWADGPEADSNPGTDNLGDCVTSHNAADEALAATAGSHSILTEDSCFFIDGFNPGQVPPAAILTAQTNAAPTADEAADKSSSVFTEEPSIPW
jgi:hypothetical protein